MTKKEDLDLEDRGDELDLEEEDIEEEELEEEEEEEEEEQEEEEEESEEEESEEDEEEEEEKEEDIKIPLSRLNEVIAQREKERERVEALQNTVNKLLEKLDVVFSQEEQDAIEESVDYDFDLAEKKYAELLLNEDLETAAKLRKEIDEKRTLLIQKQIEEAKKKSLEETKNQLEEEKFLTLRESYEKQFPIFNPESKEYNEEAIDLVNNLMAGYLASGKSKSTALKLAVERVTKFYKTEPTPERTKKAKKKAISTMKKQPPKLSAGKKVRASEFDITKISDEEFKKLSKREKAIARGDIIE